MGQPTRVLQIVHATSVHRWDDGRIFERQCRSLSERGHVVTLLAPGRRDRIVDGVHVVGIGEARGRIKRMFRLVNSIRRRAYELSPDIIVMHDPELLRLAQRHLPPTVLVYDAHEDYSAQIRDKEWLPSWLRRVASRAFGRLEQHAVRNVDLVLCATPRIAKRFAGIPTQVVLNRPALDRLPDVESIGSTEDEHSPARVVYVGDLRAVRGAHSLIDAIALVNDVRPARLEIAGRLTPTSLHDELSARRGWAHVDVLGWRPRDDVYVMLARADVAVLPFLNADNHVESQPNKLFEYMMMGVPIVATDFPLWIDLATECAARFQPAKSGDASSMADALLATLAAPTAGIERREAALRARQHFAWESIRSHYVETIEALCLRAGVTP